MGSEMCIRDRHKLLDLTHHNELQLHMHYHQHAIHNHVEDHIIPDLMFHMRLLHHSDYRASHSHHLLRKLLELNQRIHLHERDLHMHYHQHAIHIHQMLNKLLDLSLI